MACVASNLVVLLQGTVCPGLGKVKRDLVTGFQAGVRNSSCGGSGPVCGRRVGMYYQWQSPLWGSFEGWLMLRGDLKHFQPSLFPFLTMEQSWVFSLHFQTNTQCRNILVCFPPVLLLKLKVRKRETWPWRQKLHLSSVQKMLKKEHCVTTWLNITWIDVPQKLFVMHEIKCICPSRKLVSCTLQGSFCIVREFCSQQVHHCSNVEWMYCSLLIAKAVKGNFFLISYKVKAFF